MKKQYERIELEIIKLDTFDIVTSSQCNPVDVGGQTGTGDPPTGEGQ